MAGGAAVVAAAAAARQRRRQRVLDAFRIAGATAPERAQTFEAIGVHDSEDLSRLIEDGIVGRGTRDSTWYLSEAAFVAHRDARRVGMRKRALILLGCAIFILGALLGVLARVA